MFKGEFLLFLHKIEKIYPFDIDLQSDLSYNE